MPHHVVVDGSNLATEGRSNPSLKQLNEAVLAYMAEHPTALITVVVDATFGHRIDAKEVPEFDEAVANNELVAPPAGAIGRGDAFVLSIANKVNATIISNDSYQEFHGQYGWLFDEGRLIGGKPVPHVGWVFVPRLPVRGPLSRKSMSEAKRKVGRSKAEKVDETVRVGSPEASKPMPIPKSPPPGAAGGRGRGRGKAAAEQVAAEPETTAAPTRVAAEAAAPKGPTVNDLISFLTFVQHHPPGTSVNAVVDHYSSHGAYVRVGDVMGYVPLRLMAEPAPRSAREFMKIGESITLVVDSLVAGKRSIDLAVPGMGTVKPIVAPAAQEPTKPRRGGAKKAVPPAEPPAAAAPQATRPKRAAKAAVTAPARVPEAAPVPARKRAAPGATPPTKAPAATKSAPAKKAAKSTPQPDAKKTAAKRSAPAKKAAASAGGVKKAASSASPTASPRRRGATSA